MANLDRKKMRRRVRYRIRRKVRGTAERPRLAVFRSIKHIYVQAIDDAAGRTLCQASSLDAEVGGGSEPEPEPKKKKKASKKAAKAD